MRDWKNAKIHLNPHTYSRPDVETDVNEKTAEDQRHNRWRG